MKNFRKTLVAVTVILLVIFTGCNKNEPATNNDLEAITYPSTGAYGSNILSEDVTSVTTAEEYSMKAVLPKGTELTILLKGGFWFYDPNANWLVNKYDDATQSQEFTVLIAEKQADLSIDFDPKESVDGSTITVEYYENGAKTPTKTKKLTLSTNSKL